MAENNTTMLVILGLAGFYLLSKSQQTAAGVPTGSGTAARSGGGASGGLSIGTGTGTGTTATGQPIYSGSNPQTPQPTSYTTDPCNQAGPNYDQIACMNEGGTLYYGTPSNPVTTPSNISQGPATSPTDTGDPCDTSSVDYNPDLCAEMNGSVYDSSGGDGTDYSSEGL